jgi:hypothetical protein
MTASDYLNLNLADERLGLADRARDPELSSAEIASAQVTAIQAVAAAVDRLAAAIEAQ